MSEDYRDRYFNLFYKNYVVDRFDICMQYKDVKEGIKQYLKMIKYKALRKYDTKSLLKVSMCKIIKVS